MKLRFYDRSLDSSKPISDKSLRHDRPALHALSQKVPLLTLDPTAYDLCDGLHRPVFKVGIGATVRAPVTLRTLAYAAAALEFANFFGGSVEFVSGAGISASCGLVSSDDVLPQVRETFRLLRLFTQTCYREVDFGFVIPHFTDLAAIDRIIDKIESQSPEGRSALAHLCELSQRKGNPGQTGKRYGVLHAFAFDLREQSFPALVTVGNEAEDTFNSVRYATLNAIASEASILGSSLIPADKVGYALIRRCKIPPYAPHPLVNGFELLPDRSGLDSLLRITNGGRSVALAAISDERVLSVARSLIDDFDFLLRLVGFEKLESVVRAFEQGSN
ncbi:hypothetical protein HY990_05210 [Candidatus Micrarchaeota archaeon]|nr:hypothetical protein [Candidatus Micrarchaeota archaeon]